MFRAGLLPRKHSIRSAPLGIKRARNVNQTKEAKGRPRGRSFCLPDCHSLLLGGGGLFALLALVPAVFPLELLHAARRVDELHLAREERMARRADFDVDVFLGA